MAFFSIPDIILEHNIENVSHNLQQMMDSEEREERNFPENFACLQNTVRPILGRRCSLPEPPTYPRKMSADSVMSDGLLFNKTTLLPERSSYFDEVRPRNMKGFGKKFSRRGSLNSSFVDNPFKDEMEMNLTALNIFPKVCAPPPPKDLLQVLKILEDNLLHFVTLSRNLNTLHPTLFAIVDNDAGIINGLGEYFAYLVKLAIREEFWISSIAPALNLRENFFDSFVYLSKEFHRAIADAQKFTEFSGLFEETHEHVNSAEELNYWIRVLYSFIWLTLRLNGYPCQVQERNLFIGF